MEQSFLAYLRGRTRHLPQVELGIGDDAAIIAPSGKATIACADQIIDGVDFDSACQNLADVGYKAMAVNLSDIAAMGAVPDSVLVTLALPNEKATQIAGDVYEGILQAAEKFSVAIAGGDISCYDGPLSISIAMLGHVENGAAWRRDGAVQGDKVVATGSFGGSLKGRHLRPIPRIELAGEIRRLVDVHAAIDVSDGLSLDLDRMCAKSGLGVELEIDSIPIHPDAVAMAESSGRSPFQHAWSDGEDFELLLTCSEQDAETLVDAKLSAPLTIIGTVVGRTGIWRRDDNGFIRLPPQGYQHGE